jgi:hypothetical protein
MPVNVADRLRSFVLPLIQGAQRLPDERKFVKAFEMLAFVRREVDTILAVIGPIADWNTNVAIMRSNLLIMDLDLTQPSHQELLDTWNEVKELLDILCKEVSRMFVALEESHPTRWKRWFGRN